MSDKEIKLIENQSYEPRQPEPDLYSNNYNFILQKAKEDYLPCKNVEEQSFICGYMAANNLPYYSFPEGISINV